LSPREKLIELSLPLESINQASAKEKSIRHGHPSTLHMWQARCPLAACRAALYSSLVELEELTFQPDFGATSVNYEPAALLAQSQEPA